MADILSIEYWTDKSLDGLHTLIKDHPDNINLLYSAAIIFRDRNELPQAIDLWKKILKSDCNHADSIRQLILAEKPTATTETPKTWLIIDYLERLEELDVATVEDILLLGDLYSLVKEFQGAHDAYLLAGERDPDLLAHFPKLAALHARWGCDFLHKAKRSKD